MTILFIPLRKADAKQRIVTGIAAAEVADRSGEIFDYVSSKPHFESWSSNAHKLSGAKSLGNIRGMHSNIAVGKLTGINFDDRNKSIHVEAKILDDDEWNKVEEGVYTGFSIGGRYMTKWSDGALTRYTASPSEISLVDLPCIPSATFELVKMDGHKVARKFHQRPDESLVKAALQAQSRRMIPMIGPQSIDGSVSHQRREQLRSGALVKYRIEYGEVDAGSRHGRIRGMALDQGAGVVTLHGVHVDVADLDHDLHGALFRTAGAFNMAEGAEEQSSARAALGAVVAAVLDRHPWLEAKVREAKLRERYDN
jgi:hypothetical protein